MSEADVPRLSVVLPAYQEVALLASSLDRLRRHLEQGGRSWEIIVVDDGSTDATGDAARAAAREEGRIRLVTHPANLGKGAAIATGLGEARGPVVAVTDADLSYALEDMDAAVAAVRGGAPFAAGSRLLPESRIDLPFSLLPYLVVRWIGGGLFRFVVRALFGLEGVDTQCGLKACRREPASAVYARTVTRGFLADLEIFLIAREQGLDVATTPVHLSYLSRASSVSLLGGLPRILADLARIKRAQLRGHYARGPRG